MRTPAPVEVFATSAVELYDDFPLRYPVGRQRIPLEPDQTHAARLSALVKRILRKYGYPPDLQDAAVQTVLQLAEVLSASWQPGHPRA